jgi:hypothetical protein
MSYHEALTAGPDFPTCRYAGSRLTFRGPRKRASGGHIAVLGGGSTFGRYVPEPYPDLLERLTGRRVINLGQRNAGPDVFLHDGAVLDMCRAARTVVVQVMGAHALSNRFYRVHPRRNDRFVEASAAMRLVFPELDFTDFHFTRHMLSRVAELAPDRFGVLRDELRLAWLRRMEALVAAIGRPVVLLWMAPRAPQAGGDRLEDGDPAFVTRGMLTALQGRGVGLVEVGIGAPPSLEGKIFAEAERQIALSLPGLSVHRDAAEALARYLADPKP